MPDIGVNSLREVEGTKEEFVQRLFDHRIYQENLRRYNAHHTFVGEMGRDISADPVLDAKATASLINRLTVLDPEARKQRSLNLSTTIVSGIESKKESKFITNKSEKLAEKSRHKALSEIFDVLLMSVEFEKARVEQQQQQQPDSVEVPAEGAEPSMDQSRKPDSCSDVNTRKTDSSIDGMVMTDVTSSPTIAISQPINSSGMVNSTLTGIVRNEKEANDGDGSVRSRSSRSVTPSSRRNYIGSKRADVLSRSPQPKSSEGRSANEITSNPDASLDLQLVRPYLLENRHLADTIASVLQQAYGLGFDSITRAQFLAISDDAIDRGLTIPINFILSSVSHNTRREAPENSETIASNECTSTPTQLPAKKVNEKLIRNRYKLRTAGLQSIEDSLHEC